jgi:hypothetical protein
MPRKGILQPLILAAILATGFVVAWGLISLWAVEVGVYVAGSDRAHERLLILPDGTPRVVREQGQPGSPEYLDLEGHPVPPPESDVAGWLTGGHLPASLPAEGANGWDRRIRTFADGQLPAVFWYLLSDGRPDGTAYFVGYDSKSKACVGYLGTAGFREGPPPAEELIPFGGRTAGPQTRVLSPQSADNPTGHPRDDLFARGPHGSVAMWDVYVFGRDGQLYHADLRHRTLRVILDQLHLRSAALVAGVPDPVRGTSWRLAVRTDDAVLLLDEADHVSRQYLIPDELRGQGFTFAETTTGEAVMFWNSPFDELATNVEYRIWWVDENGRCREARTGLSAPGNLRPTQVFGAAVAPAPLVLGGFVAFGRTKELLEAGLAGSYPEALLRAVSEFWPALAIAQLLAAGLALLSYRRQVRYGAGPWERVIWPLFVLLLGLPGWVGYRFGRSWTAVDACPSCGVGVPRDRENCVRCEAEFPAAAPRGTEVFA